MPNIINKLDNIDHDFSKPNYSFKIESTLLNYFYGFSGLNLDTIKQLQQLSETASIQEKLARLLSEENYNNSENRQVNHHHLRDFSKDSLYKKEFYKVKEFVNDIHSKKIKGYSNKAFDTVIQIGIGGSELGPKTIHHALNCLTISQQKTPLLKGLFIANIDPIEFKFKMENINPEQTLFIFASKSGNTQETESNISLLKTWWKNQNQPLDQLSKHCISCTTQQSALDNNALARYRFYIDEHIGGRFSTCSVMSSVILGLSFGINQVEDLLAGAYEQDKTLFATDIQNNMSLLAALIGIVERNKFNYTNKALIPYSFALNYLPAYIQQLDCESNGKSVSRNGDAITYQTSPIIFGQSGSNAQHSFFQLIHQGSDIIPIEFIAIKNFELTLTEDIHAAKLLNTNLLAQQLALFEGDPNNDLNKHFPGNRPTTLLSLKTLSAKSLGALIAFYENKIMFQGFIWDLNSFDQEGVQLGKTLAKNIEQNPTKFKKLSTIL